MSGRSLNAMAPVQRAPKLARMPVPSRLPTLPPAMRFQQLAGNRAFVGLQTKLTINQPGDAYEVEADGIADRVMRMPEPAVQRKCACGGTCNECQEEESTHVQRLHTSAAVTRLASDAPASIANVLSARGEPIDFAARSFLEPRFGADLSAVRIHRDANAAKSAHDIQALAYTVGQNVVFGRGQYAPGTSAGRRLLAHELVHVMQQGSAPRVQRQLVSREQPSAKPPEEELYVAGDKARAYWQLSAPERAEINRRVDEMFRKETGKSHADPKDPTMKNKWLRLRDQLMAERLKATKAGKPVPVCGPNVTAPIATVVSKLKSLFHGWSRTKKAAHCNALVEPPQAAFAWDIVQLHKNKWILWYRCPHPSSSCPIADDKPAHPVCATWGQDPQCGSTVQVGKDCYYAGSANYVVFGVMCKLCRDFLTKNPTTRFFGGMQFTEGEMVTLVELYKAGGLTGSNVGPAKEWARAGYHGWPSGGTPPPGDRPTCLPVCPTHYHDSQGVGGGAVHDFEITWCPSLNPYAECSSDVKALESIVGAGLGGML